jgi:hypothetical protein
MAHTAKVWTLKYDEREECLWVLISDSKRPIRPFGSLSHFFLAYSHKWRIQQMRALKRHLAALGPRPCWIFLEMAAMYAVLLLR